MASRRKVTGNLKLVHEMYGPKAPHIPQEEFKRDFADAIAYNDEIDKHFNKVPSPVHWACTCQAAAMAVLCHFHTWQLYRLSVAFSCSVRV